MLTHFFDNTKPKGILFCGLYVLFFVILYKIFLFNTNSFLLQITEIISIMLFLVGNIWLIYLLKNQNEFTKSQNYVFLFFVSFVNFFPEIYKHYSVLCVNFFVMVAFLLLSKIEYVAGQKKRIFDASLCISLAAICYDWALLYIVLIWLVVFLSTSEPFRNGLIPWVALVVVAVLSSCVALLFGESYWLGLIENFQFSLGFDFQKYSLKTFVFSVVFWGLLVLAFVLFYFFQQKIKRSLSFLMFGYLLVSLGILLLSERIGTAECIFVALPITLLLSSQFDKISKKWLQECLLWVVLISPFAVFLMYCNIL